MTMTPLVGRCCPTCATTNAARLSSRQNRTRLIFHVFMFAFLNEDLDSFLSDKWKHDQRADRISPSQIHGITHQHCDEQNQRTIGIGEREKTSRPKRLASQLYRKRLHIRTGNRYHQHRNRSDADRECARLWPAPQPQYRRAKIQASRRCDDISISDELNPPVP